MGKNPVVVKTICNSCYTCKLGGIKEKGFHDHPQFVHLCFNENVGCKPDLFFKTR